MQSIVWPSTCLTAIVFALVPSTRQQRFGIPSQANIYLHILVIKGKLSRFLSIQTVCLLLLDQWIVLQNFGMYRWEKFIPLLRDMKESLSPCISIQMVTLSLLDLLIKPQLFGMLVLASQSISSQAIKKKSQARNLNLLENIALLHPSMEPAAYGMFEWVNV